MGRQTAWVLALLVTYVAGATSAAPLEQQARPAAAQVPAAKESKDKEKPQNGPVPGDRERWKWWLYDRVELGINDQQSAAINQIFESTIPKLRETRQEMDRAEEELSRTIKEHKADIAVVSGQLDRVESARSQYNKTRVLMLYRMHLLLSAEQRTKLEVIRERNDQGRRDRQPSPGYRRYP